MLQYNVGIIAKDKYGVLQYKITKYLLPILIILIKIKLINQNFIKTTVRNLYTLAQ